MCNCNCKCEPVLQPAILFHVSRRRTGVELSSFPAWDSVGHTIDLSTALRYKDAPLGAWISVKRGFIDDNGCLYDEHRRPVRKVCLPVRGC